MKTWSDYGLDPRGSGDRQYSTCPKCSHTRKKKHVRCVECRMDTGSWTCHHCPDGRWGTLKDGWNGEATRKPVRTFTLPVYTPKADLTDKSKDYLIGERKLTEEVLVRNQVTDGKVYLPQLESERLAIHFPYFRDGQVVNVKYRGPQKSFRLEAGAERILYGIDDIKDAPFVVICEGEIDKLSIEVAGIQGAVSVPNGAPPVNSRNYERQFEFLNDERLEEVKEFYIAVDADEPGQKLEQELVRRLDPDKCRRVVWPEGLKDANQVLVELGAEALREAILNAKPYPIAGVIEVHDILPEIYTLYHEGLKGGVSTGFSELDKYFRPRLGEFSLWTGKPFDGKTSMMNQVLVNLAKIHGWTFAVCSPESRPMSRLVSRLAQIYLGKPFREGFRQRMNEQEMRDAVDWVHEHFVFVQPDYSDLTLDKILELITVQVKRRGVKGAVIDPWNSINHLYPGNMTEVQYIHSALTKILHFTSDRQIHFNLVAHPKQLVKGTDGKYPVVTPYDINGGAPWFNRLDNILSIYRMDNVTQLHVQKVRFDENGEPGMVEFTFDVATGIYTPVPPIHPEFPSPVSVVMPRYGGLTQEEAF